MHADVFLGLRGEPNWVIMENCRRRKDITEEEIGKVIGKIAKSLITL